MSHKIRLTVTIDPELAEAGASAVADGRAESVSAWVNHALAERVVRERRLLALGDAIEAYEAEFGVITDEEIARQQRADRAAARVVRSAPRRRRPKGAA